MAILFIKYRDRANEAQIEGTLSELKVHLKGLDDTVVEYVLLEDVDGTTGDDIESLITYCEFWETIE